MFKLALETLTIKLSQYVVELLPVAINHDHVTGITLFRFFVAKIEGTGHSIGINRTLSVR
jgi:hypothetical protein